MDKLGEWYWRFGTRRGEDPSDPDRELRKVSVGGWLDPLERIVGRFETIREHFDGKACVALWGPSQTGKSTLLSRYIDGAADGGGDSALTWDAAHPVRFSPSAAVGSQFPDLYPDSIVFNPYNFQSDASGVATRYVLREDNDASVNPLFPIEIRLATRVQLLHALALGYWTECNPVDEKMHFQKVHFLSDLPQAEAGTADAPGPEAYALLKDAADVIELMRNEERFSNLFAGGEWERKIRPQFVSCPALLRDAGAAKDKLTELLWDRSERMTEFFDRVETLRAQLLGKWKGAKRIVATPEVAALLLDIDTYRSFVNPNGAQGRKVQDRVSRLAWEFDTESGEVRISVGSSGSEIAGEAFGPFQVLCAELVVPLRQSCLSASGKEPFLRLMERCDLVDLPGLSNKNRGSTVSTEDNVDLVNLTAASDCDLYTRVFKEGKTQSFVYSYAQQFGVDAFIILVRANLWPGKSALLSNGVLSWIRSYDPEWKKGRPVEMPVFLDMTFFASVVNDVARNGVGNGLSPVVSRVQDTLTFAGKETSEWFVTTYNQFPAGSIERPEQKDQVVRNVLGDEAFCPRTGIGKTALEAVFEEDGGVGFMLERVAARIDPERRRRRCREIFRKDWQAFSQMVQRHLPTDEEAGADERKRLLQECVRDVRAELAKIEERTSETDFVSFSGVLKGMFSASQEVFDPIPFRILKDPQAQVDYLKQQVAKWFEDKMVNLPDSSVLDEQHLRAVFGTLRDAVRIEGEGGLAEYLANCLGQIADRRTAESARLPFALAFGNVLRCGTWRRIGPESDEAERAELLERLLAGEEANSRKCEDSPYWPAVFKPLLERMEELEGVAQSGKRPPQPGDDELQSLLQQFQPLSSL